MEKVKVTIYTDGACKGNPGPGGIGVVVKCNGETTEVKKAYDYTTNNRMEISSVIHGLELITQPSDITIYSDSKYVIDSLSKGWLDGWIKKGWTRGKNEPVKNVDLWKKLVALKSSHTVSYVWVKGHAGNPGNERCDQLANDAISSGLFIKDEAYCNN